MASLDMFCMLQPAVYSSALCTLLQKYNQSPELLDGQIYFDKKDAGNTIITTRIPWVFAKVRIPEPRWFRLNCLFWWREFQSLDLDEIQLSEEPLSSTFRPQDFVNTRAFYSSEDLKVYDWVINYDKALKKASKQERDFLDAAVHFKVSEVVKNYEAQSRLPPKVSKGLKPIMKKTPLLKNRHNSKVGKL